MAENELSLSIEKRVINILMAEGNIGERKITVQSNLQNDISLESIDIINVLFELEDEFNIEIPDQDMENARTVGDIVTYVQKKVSTPVTNSEATSSTTG